MTVMDMTAHAAGVRLGVVIECDPLVVELSDGQRCEPESLVPICACDVGASVAITTTDHGSELVLGVIGGASRTSVSLPGGFRAHVTTRGADAGVRVEDERGVAILAFDPVSGAVSIAARGELLLAAGSAVRVMAPRVELSSAVPAASSASVLGLDAGGVTLRAPELRVGVGDVGVDAGTVGLRAESVHVRSEEADVGVVRVRLAAERVRATLSAWFAQIKDVAQTRAGRLRLIVDGSADIRAGEIRARADREVDIDGSRINLG